MRKKSLLKKALAIALSISMIASSGVVAFADGEEVSFFDEDVVVEQADESAGEALFEEDSFSDEASFGFEEEVEEEASWEDSLNISDYINSNSYFEENIVEEESSYYSDNNIDQSLEVNNNQIEVQDITVSTANEEASYDITEYTANDKASLITAVNNINSSFSKEGIIKLTDNIDLGDTNKTGGYDKSTFIVPASGSKITIDGPVC